MGSSQQFFFFFFFFFCKVTLKKQNVLCSGSVIRFIVTYGDKCVDKCVASFWTWAIVYRLVSVFYLVRFSVCVSFV